MLLHELFEPKPNITFKWENNNNDYYSADAELGDDDIRIYFYIRQAEAFVVEFGVNDEFGITGGGNAAQIFAIVLAGIRDFIAKFKPRYLIFDAAEPTRERLYRRMVNRLSQDMGYRKITIRSLPKELDRGEYGVGDFILKRVSKI